MFHISTSPYFSPNLPFPTGVVIQTAPNSRPFADDFQRLALRGALQQQRRRRGAAPRRGQRGVAGGVRSLGAVLVDEVRMGGFP